MELNELKEIIMNQIKISQAPVYTSRIAIVAKVNSTVDADDHVLHICDVTTVYADNSVEAIFGWNGYAELAPAQKK